ncbi:MAG: tRNA preQ1(34) S-adenosylmethionine ribosyltransferase-isomerase QueA [Pyrinomonadaceae bacterium]
MKLSDFYYDLPEELIAQQPLADRAGSRMLVVNKAAGTFSDDLFAGLPDRLLEGDVLVLNNTKVFPARLIGISSTGASVEIFLLEKLSGDTWEALARPAKRLNPGKSISFGDKLSAEVLERSDGGKIVVKFSNCNGDFFDVLDEIGITPLPPYIKREQSAVDTDRDRYQTVFAATRGAIAAPTAGLHFTPAILDTLRSKGVIITEITLHVGYGTFEPVRVNDISAHTVMPERFEIGENSADILNRAAAEGRRIIAVGTTTTRALEAEIDTNGKFNPSNGLAKITITPGYRFRAVNGLLTNFHLPESSLLVLVSTFGGHGLIMDAYRHAVAGKYRFYSYGDCMFLA